MKKFIFVLFAMAVFMSCKDDEKLGSELEENYISIEQAIYHAGNFPEATSSEKITDILTSDQVMNGAANFITVTSKYEIKKFFLGIIGVNGYLEYIAARASTDSYIYIIPLMIAQNFSGNAELLISALLDNGGITIPTKYPLYQLETRPGALEIKLAFSNEKDVDIHVFTPSGIHIFFGSSKNGYYYGESEDYAYPFGLDIDSNAACGIDGINKENIFIPEEYVENGTYYVAVDMYDNCFPSIATSWFVTAWYNGKLITPNSGRNPASGVFAVGTPSSYCENLVDVMTFNISNAGKTKAVLDPMNDNVRTKSSFNYMDSPKLKRKVVPENL